jgi:CHAD domain-containing protein
VTFWDTFEWGLWFGGHILFSCENVYHLCSRENGWLNADLCSEKSGKIRRFWSDFTTEPMRESLEGMLRLRALSAVAEGRISTLQGELHNKSGKIVCRFAWSSVAAGRHEGKVLLQSCLVLPLLGYEDEAARVVACLIRCGATVSGDGPLDVLLNYADCVPQQYTLRPAFGLITDVPARKAVGQIVRPMLALANRNVPGIISDLDTEFLHDYRICLRKARSLLSLVKGVYPVVDTNRMRSILGDLARQTNRLRDLDVYLLARSEYSAFLPPGLRPALETVFEDFAAAREKELRRVVTALRSAEHTRLLKELEDFFAEETFHGSAPAAELPVGPIVYRSIYRRYRKICTIATGFGENTPDETTHRIRIECKKLRYLMEFFSEILPRIEASELISALRRLQNRLGEFNDASVQQQSLLDYWKRHDPGSAPSLGLGGLVAILYQRRSKTRATIVNELETFAGKPTAALFKRTFKLQAPSYETDV